MKNFGKLFILMVAAMMLTNCSEEQIVSDCSLSGDSYRVKVEIPEMRNSRTVIGEERNSDGKFPTYWQQDDRIYISSRDGKTNAEMDLQSISDDGQYAYFYGYLLGSQSDLEYAVYPVPDKNGQISLGTHEWESTDIPMIATYGEDKDYVSFKNTVGVVRLVINNFPGGNVEVTGEGISGVAKVAGPDNNGMFYLDWETDKNNKINITSVPKDNKQVIYVPIITDEVLTVVNEQNIAALEDRTITIKLDNGASITNTVKVAIAQVSASETTSFLELTYHADTNELTEAWDGEASEEVELEGGIIKIHNAAQLKNFADKVNNGTNFKGVTISLENDIDLNKETWTPIGLAKDGGVSFRGIFEGNGKTIKNIVLDQEAGEFKGFFGQVWGATIKNLKLEGVNAETSKLIAKVNGTSTEDGTTALMNVVVDNSKYDNLIGTIINEGVVTIEGNKFISDGVLADKMNDEVKVIYSEMGLLWLAEQVNDLAKTFDGKTVMLGADIDLNNHEWTPIGNSTNKFQGTFDGQNHTISNLFIEGEGNSNQGLFGMTTNGEIKNLTVENAQIRGRLNVGVVAGTPYTSKYTNITLKGLVQVDGMAYVGGVGGKNAYADWTNITVDVEEGSYVKANSVENGIAYRTYVGGVIGFMGEGGHSFTNVKSNIDVTGSTIDVGGITGIAHYNNNFINCSSSGDVTITDATEAAEAEEIGGIAGVWHNGNGYQVTFTGCSFTGTLKANITEGIDLSDNNITGKAYSAEGTGKLIINGKQIIANGVAINSEGEYELSTAKAMFWFAEQVNEKNHAFAAKTVKLTANVDLKNQDWEPIGQTGATEFKGVFDGQDYTISNLNIDSEKETGSHYSSALFGWIESHGDENITIKNVRVNGAKVNGHHNVATIAGYATGSVTVLNCHVTGATINCTFANSDASGDKAGVVIGNGTAEPKAITNCTAANSTVKAGRDAGQVIGACKESKVSGCTATNVTVSANGTGTGANIRNEVIGRLL